MTNNDLPLISIVTVTYNAHSVLEETILSVINQTYSNIEYIIIDGGSTDGTIDIIKKYQDKISYYVSESDKGVYDAMNKGINKVTGDWVNFMNAGDLFSDNHVLTDTIGFINKELDATVIYGNTVLRYPSGLSNIKAKPLNLMDKGMPFCHQSSFVKSNFLKERLFDLSYKVAADYDLFYYLFKQNHKFVYIDRYLSIYDYSDGLSVNNERRMLKEYANIQGINNSISFLLKYYIRIITLFVKSFLPDGVIYVLRKR